VNVWLTRHGHTVVVWTLLIGGVYLVVRGILHLI
jgi:hypothetical protein